MGLFGGGRLIRAIGSAFRSGTIGRGGILAGLMGQPQPMPMGYPPSGAIPQYGMPGGGYPPQGPMPMPSGYPGYTQPGYGYGAPMQYGGPGSLGAMFAPPSMPYAGRPMSYQPATYSPSQSFGLAPGAGGMPAPYGPTLQMGMVPPVSPYAGPVPQFRW